MAVEDSGAPEDKLLLFQQSLGVSYPLYYDTSNTVTKTFGIRATSSVFVISPDFVVRERAENGATKRFLETSWQTYGTPR